VISGVFSEGFLERISLGSSLSKTASNVCSARPRPFRTVRAAVFRRHEKAETKTNSTKVYRCLIQRTSDRSEGWGSFLLCWTPNVTCEFAQDDGKGCRHTTTAQKWPGSVLRFFASNVLSSCDDSLSVILCEFTNNVWGPTWEERSPPFRSVGGALYRAPKDFCRIGLSLCFLVTFRSQPICARNTQCVVRNWGSLESLGQGASEGLRCSVIG
jgi:hypothetical protein